MAVDEAILEGVCSGNSQPTLRLYAWQPACLSLGYAQPFSEVDSEALAAKGWDIVRRPTGGRAILHVDELTYAVIAPDTDPRVAGSVLDSYLRLSEALLEALRLIGLSPEANEKTPEKSRGRPITRSPSMERNSSVPHRPDVRAESYSMAHFPLSGT